MIALVPTGCCCLFFLRRRRLRLQRGGLELGLEDAMMGQ